MCISIVCKPSCNVMNFEVNLIFLIKRFFLHDQKVVTNTNIPWERKDLLRWNKKTFFITSKGLSIKQITFGRIESDFTVTSNSLRTKATIGGVLLNILQYLHESTCVRVFFKIKLQALTSLKNTYFEEQLQTTASVRMKNYELGIENCSWNKICWMKSFSFWIIVLTWICPFDLSCPCQIFKKSLWLWAHFNVKRPTSNN